MLIQFVVENFRSFRDKAVLSMRASQAYSREHTSLYIDAGTETIMRAAAMYGANASGKSNLINAIDVARDLIVEGTSARERLPYFPFKLDPECLDQPTRFEFAFVHEHTQYSYGFLIDAGKVHAEWLFRGPDDQEERLFEREFDDSREGYTFELGDALVSDPRRRQFYEFLHEGTRPNQLFLRESEERNATELEPPRAWFRDQLVIIAPNARYAHLATRTEEFPEFRRFLSELIARADTGIHEIALKRSRRPMPAPPEWLEGAQDELQKRLEELGRVRLHEGDAWEELTRTPEGELEIERVRLIARHVSKKSKGVDFELVEESDGTRRLMHLAPMLYQFPREQGQVYVVDEIERSLHPLLTHFFLREFLGGSGQNNQLVCATHDVNLLDVELLDPGAIWFVEKDGESVSHLYSLDEFDDKQLTALRHHKRRGYLEGRFGAIPFLGDARRLLPDDPDPGAAGDED